MSFQTHPTERRNEDGKIIPFDLRYIHLSEARGKAHRLNAAQLATELGVIASHYDGHPVIPRHWYRAIIEEAALRLRAVDGA